MTVTNDFRVHNRQEKRMLQPNKNTFRDTASKIEGYTSKLSVELRDMREAFYPPQARKSFTRTFSTLDLVRLLNVPESTLRQLTIEGRGPQPERAENNRRTYTIGQVQELRYFLAELRPEEAKQLLPHRQSGERLQIFATPTSKVAAPRQQPLCI